MKVIAISGWKRSGKDTAAEVFIKNGYKRVGFADPLKDMVADEYDVPRNYCDDPQFKEAPLLHLPVSPKDDFTLNVAKMMFKEFRTAEGYQVPEYFVDASGTFLGLLPGKGVFTDAVQPVQLYWTPRALCILKGSTNRAVRSDYWVQAAIEHIELEANGANNYYRNPQLFVISDLRYKSETQQLRDAFGKNLITVRINRFDTCASTDASERDLDDGRFDVVIDNKGSLEEFLEKVNKLV